MRAMNDFPLRGHNTFGLDVRAARFLEYTSEEELEELIHTGQITEPYLHIGGGSNLLFTDECYPGTILHSCIRGISVTSEDDASICLRVGAGTVWDDFVRQCVENGWQGVENLSLIPGEVGAAAVQNIGAYGVEAKDVITAIETLDISGHRKTYPAEACGYAYRQSLFKRPEMKPTFITHVHFRLNKAPRFHLDYGALREALGGQAPTVALVREAVIRIRRSKLPDPKELGNAGSFFMNPIIPRARFEELKKEHPSIPHYDVDENLVKVPAGWLIEQCGWKGKSLGPAAVYSKQALVLVNTGGATGADIVHLARAVQASVREKFDINIQPEVLFV